MRTLLQDFRYGFRVLLKKPMFTIAAVLSLALGIGACTAIFSVVDGVLLRPLPFPESQRIVRLYEINENGTKTNFTDPNFLDIKAQNKTLDAVAEYRGGATSIIGGSEAIRTNAAAVSGDFFRVFGVQPFIGRSFTEDESKAGASGAAVVSYGYWQKYLAAKKDLSGTTLTIYGQSFAVVGVMPSDFNFPNSTEVWYNREVNQFNKSRTAHNWQVVARLRQDVSFEQAQSELSAIAKPLKQQYGKEMDAKDFAPVSLQETLVNKSRNMLMLLFGAVGLLLLIACANVANLLLAQTTERQKELAVRAALGASRLRLARQFIIESIVLTLMASALGIMISFWGVEVLLSLNKENLPRANEVGLDSRVLIFTIAVSFVVAITLGIITTIRNSKLDIQTKLKESGLHATGAFASRFRSALLVTQVALTFVLLIGAGLLGKSFFKLLQVDPGFQPESAVAMNISLPTPRDENQMTRLGNFHAQLLERLKNLPGVVSVGGVSELPMSGGGRNGTFLIDDDKEKKGEADFRVASSDYFAAMKIPVLSGRLFDASDLPNSQHVAVISQTLAQRYWKNENPIGKQIQFGNMDGDKRMFQIVGVVGDVRDYGLEKNIQPTVYAYYLQRPRMSGDFSIVVRANSNPTSLVSAMRQEVLSLDKNVPTNFRTLEQIFSSSLNDQRFNLVLFGVFAGVAMILALMGIYSLMAYSVTQRTHEIGIRMALGAKAQDVLKLVIRQGMMPVIIGVCLGLIAALALTKLISSFLYNVSPTDTFTFSLISFALLCAALLACYLPARRASKIDPIIALRYE